MTKVVPLSVVSNEPPSDHALEQNVIGAVLIDNRLFDECASLRAEDFDHDLHVACWKAIASLIERGEEANPVKVRPLVGDHPSTSNVGGYLSSCVAECISTYDVAHQAGRIADLAKRRLLILEAQRLIAAAHDRTADVPATDLAAKATHALDTVVDRTTGEGFRSSEAVGAEIIDRLDKMGRGEIKSVKTGLADLDRVTGGLEAGGLYIAAGRPGMGKTAFALALTINAARNGVPVGFVSLEMSAAQLGCRVLGAKLGVPYEDVRRGNVGDWNALLQAEAAMARLPIHYMDKGAIRLDAIKAYCRSLIRKHQVGLLVIDYLQLIEPSSDKRNRSRVEDVTEISRGLKLLAKDLGVPVLALSQLSRQVESREDKRPRLSDLRESGAIEQDADAVMFLYREEYYLNQQIPERGKEAEHAAALDAAKNILEVDVAKNRHGSVGRVNVFYDAAVNRIHNLEAR